MEGGNRFDIAGRAEDDLVRRAGVGAAGPVAGLTITGFLGNSPRDGYRRIYLDRSLERYVEFAVDDVVDGREVPAGESPFVGEQATRCGSAPTRASTSRGPCRPTRSTSRRGSATRCPSRRPGTSSSARPGDCGSARSRCTRAVLRGGRRPRGRVQLAWFRP